MQAGVMMNSNPTEKFLNIYVYLLILRLLIMMVSFEEKWVVELMGCLVDELLGCC